MTFTDFYCPKCGNKTRAMLYYDMVPADPLHRATINFGYCHTDWGIKLYEVEQKEKD